MSANRIFLVCTAPAHHSFEHALCIATRHDAESRYYCASNCRCLKCKCADKERARRNEWFEKHAACGVDGFKLAYQRSPGWDVSPPAPEVAAAVRMALVTNGSGGKQ